MKNRAKSGTSMTQLKFKQPFADLEFVLPPAV